MSATAVLLRGCTEKTEGVWMNNAKNWRGEKSLPFWLKTLCISSVAELRLFICSLCWTRKR